MRIRMTALIAIVAVVGLVAAAGTGGATGIVGSDCVQPLDLLSGFQDLSNCNLRGVTITGGGLYESNLTGANLNRATIGGGYKELQFADLDGANLNDARIGTPLFGMAVAQSASLRAANLHSATIAGFRDLSFTDLTGANLNNASVTGPQAFLGAHFDNTTCPDGTNSDNDGDTCVGHGIPDPGE